MSMLRPNQRSAHQTDAPLTTTVHVTNFCALVRKYHKVEMMTEVLPGYKEARMDTIRGEIQRIGGIIMDRTADGDIIAATVSVPIHFIECDLWS